MTLSITTFNIECIYDECCCAGCHIFTITMNVTMLNVIILIVNMLSVIILIVNMLSMIILIVIMLSVVASTQRQR